MLGGIEAALWDLKGKLEGVPVYALLGGRKHDSLLCYATGGPSNYPEERLAKKIDYYLSLGFHGFKVAAGRLTAEGFTVDTEPNKAADFEASKLQFIRLHAGKDVAVMLDGHMGNSHSATWDFETALAVARAIEPFDLTFLEEPLHYTDIDGYSRLCEATRTPIAGGECLTAFCEWEVFVKNRCFHIGQPDASFLPGLGQFMQIAGLLESHGRFIATHSWGYRWIVDAEYPLRIRGGEYAHSRSGA